MTYDETVSARKGVAKAAKEKDAEYAFLLDLMNFSDSLSAAEGKAEIKATISFDTGHGIAYANLVLSPNCADAVLPLLSADAKAQARRTERGLNDEG